MYISSIKVTVLGQSQGKKTLTFPYTLFETIFLLQQKDTIEIMLTNIIRNIKMLIQKCI